MTIIKHFVTILLCISLGAQMTPAQSIQNKQQETQTTKPLTQDVLIIIQQEKVRFTAQKAVAEMQLQIIDQAGQIVYDSGAVTEPELTWALQQAGGEMVKSGLYAYTLSLKEAGAEAARVQRGHFIVDRARERDGQTDRLWITSQNESGVGTELTVARSEDVTIAGTSATSEQKSGLVGRDGEAGPRDSEVKLKNERPEGSVAIANGTAGRIAKFTSSTDLGNSVMTELNGKIGIGKTSPQNLLHVGPGNSSIVASRVNAVVASNTTDAGIAIAQSGGINVLLQASGSGGYIGTTSNHPLIFRSNDIDRLVVAENGNIGIGVMWAPTSRLEIVGQDGLGIIGYQPFLTLSDATANGTFRSRIQNVNGGLNFQTHDLTVLGGTAMYIQDDTHNVGIGTSQPQYKLDVNGITRTSLLLITGGADFAENFEVNVTPTSESITPKVEAGMVVSLDSSNPGQLILSTQAYDRRVAGIISGAGGVKPGMVMNQEGTMADGKHPVALSGRVYCWADASQVAIEVGDLLTTSSTPGHAMKAVDGVKAQGAIIGKAMTGLKEGKGLVLVLVTLQ